MNPKLFNEDYLYHLCQKYGLRPDKKYGQNYLIDHEPILKMVEAGDVNKKDTVVEVGPGFGVLTFELAEKAKKVVSFEIEKKLEEYWNDAAPENLKIVWGNVLRNFNSEEFGEYKVVANLPYQITSNVIRTFLEAKNQPKVMLFMVQKEVAERICAEPGDMSLLALSVQYYADPEIVAQVPRTLFWPSPEVDSAIIKIVPKKTLEEADKEFFDLAKAGFAQKRKLLIKNLLPIIGKEKKQRLQSVFSELGLDELVRAQELSVQEWKQLVIHLSA